MTSQGEVSSTTSRPSLPEAVEERPAPDVSLTH
jgi:hypothetical protein